MVWKDQLSCLFWRGRAYTWDYNLWGGGWAETAGRVFQSILFYITYYFGWYYVIILSAFLAFVVWLFCSPYGKVRLGSDDSQPEFGLFSWFSMLFAAGMGMGLIFWGVAEPIMHYTAPPTADPETLDAMRESMRFSFFLNFGSILN